MKKNTPIELARQAFVQLSNDKSPPTPDNYRRAYNKLAGIEFVDQSALLNKSLEKVLYEMGKERPKLVTVAQSIHKLVEKPDPTKLEELLHSLLSTGTGEAAGVNWTTLLHSLLKQLEVNHGNLSLSKKIENLNHILIKFANDPNQLGQKMHILITSWGKGPITQEPAETNHTNEKNEIGTQPSIQTIVLSSDPLPHTDDSQRRLAIIWRDMLIRAVNLAVVPNLQRLRGRLRE